jgi:ubiquinol-cytochrome c reductase cytochrome b subunit
LHYLLPFVVCALIGIHIFYLHLAGRSNPMGISSSTYKIPFHPYYTVKDRYYFLLAMFIIGVVTLMFGYNLIDAENFIPANALVTPIHIQPE